MKIENNTLRILKPKFGFAIFLVCLLISISSWISLKLSKDHFMQLEIKIAYKNIPKGLLVDNRSDSIFHISFKTTGFNSLTSNQSNKKRKIVLDLLTVMKKGESKTTLSYAILESLVKDQLNINNLEITAPDSVNIYLKQQVRKKVPIISLITFNTQRQYFVCDSILIKPDSAWIMGLENEVAKVKYVTTELKHLSELSSTFLGQFQLKTNFGNSTSIQIAPASTGILIPVEKYTESVIRCKISRVQTADYELKTFPNAVKIKYYVGFSKYKTITDSSFTIIPDMDKAINNKVPLKINRIPKNVRVVEMSPNMVEFLKIKR